MHYYKVNKTLRERGMKMKTKVIAVLMVVGMIFISKPSFAGDEEWATAGKVLAGVVGFGILTNAIADHHCYESHYDYYSPAPVYRPAPVCYYPERPVYRTTYVTRPTYVTYYRPARTVCYAEPEVVERYYY